MATLSYTKETMPKSSEEFQRDLADVTARSNPIDDLLELAAELRCFEEKHKMASAEFYRRFQAGQMGDEMAMMEWAAIYDLYWRTRRSIELILIKASVQSTVAEMEPA